MHLASAVGLTPMQAKVGTFGIKLLWKKCQPVLITTVVVFSSIKIYSLVMKKLRRKKWAQAGKDVVVLHSFPRGIYCPNISPFVLKLETYLRLSKIEYILDYEEPMGPRGKCPWITLNGEEFSDSQLIIEMLSKKYNKDFSSWLTDEQTAVARAMMIMVEDHLYWCCVYVVYHLNNGKNFFQNQKVPLFLMLLYPFIKKLMKKKLIHQGIGLFNVSEFGGIIEKDLKSLSIYLGNKPYMMGDKICELDCSVFSLLCLIKWDSIKSPYHTIVQEKYSNLFDYCDRVKENLWPDWDQCLDK